MTNNAKEPIDLSPPAKNGRKDLWLFLIMALLCYLARIALTNFGYNFDFESFQLVTEILEKGQNVYVTTERYNYSPIWMFILMLLKAFGATNFRLALSMFVSAVDIAIAWFFYKSKHTRAAYLMLLSPVCIIISGFHNQFDNLAILVSLLAVGYVQEKGRKWDARLETLSTMELFVVSCILGISIATKHILLFFPIWLLFPPRLSINKKLVLFLVPYALFLGSFAFHLADWSSILNRVFLYNPHLNAPTYNMLLPKSLLDILNFFGVPAYRFVFYSLIICGGYLLRKRPFFELVFFYFLFIVLFSSSLYTHYLVIPMVFLAFYHNRYWYWYNGCGLVFFILHQNQFNLVSYARPPWREPAEFIEIYGYYPLMLTLLLAAVEVLYPNSLNRSIFKLFHKVV